MEDIFNLQRFLDAQSYDYERAFLEIKNGRKQSHWVWYIFPQLKGFGHSYNSEYYGISGLEEAKAYYNHPVLGARLIEITKALLEHRGKSAQDILSPIDARKVRSSMTLFWLASANPLFKEVIDLFYEGKMDNKTISKTGVTPQSPPSITPETINMRYHQNPFKVEHLDFLIVEHELFKYDLDEDGWNVTKLYNLFGRWFSKRFISDRIRYIDEICKKESKKIPSYMEANGCYEKAHQELKDFKDKTRKAEYNEDRSQIVDTDIVILVEINNLCHFNEPWKVPGLLKYIVPKWDVSSYVLGFTPPTNLAEMRPMGLRVTSFGVNHIRHEVVLFFLGENGVPHMIGYISKNKDANYLDAFSLDFSNTKGWDEDEWGCYYCLDIKLNLNKVINYSGPDYVPMFRIEGDKITSCYPPLLRHKYRLKPLYIPGDGKESEYFDKYYDLYHTGNWKAKEAIERGGFNLNG